MHWFTSKLYTYQNCTTSVSYTHLDVYKRQICNRVKFNFFVLIKIICVSFPLLSLGFHFVIEFFHFFKHTIKMFIPFFTNCFCELFKPLNFSMILLNMVHKKFITSSFDLSPSFVDTRVEWTPESLNMAESVRLKPVSFLSAISNYGYYPYIYNKTKTISICWFI